MAILSQLAGNTQLKASARSITGGDNLHDDLFQFSLLKLYDMGEDRVIEISKEGNIAGYMNVMMYRFWTDKASAFNKTHRPELYTTDPSTVEAPEYVSTSTRITQGEIDLCLQYFDGVSPERLTIAKELQRIEGEYKRNKRFNLPAALIEFYVSCGGNIVRVSEKTGIPVRALRYQFKKTFDQLRENTANK